MFYKYNTPTSKDNSEVLRENNYFLIFRTTILMLKNKSYSFNVHNYFMSLNLTILSLTVLGLEWTIISKEMEVKAHIPYNLKVFLNMLSFD